MATVWGWETFFEEVTVFLSAHVQWYWPRHVGLGRGRGRGSGDNICDIIDHRKSLHPASRNPTLRRENLSTLCREITPRISRPCVESSPPCVGVLDPASKNYSKNLSTLRRELSTLRRTSRPCVESSPPCVERLLFLLQTACHTPPNVSHSLVLWSV